MESQITWQNYLKKRQVVIIGLGGITGSSVAHHLIERGWDDIVGIDKSAIPTDIGSTAHASDFCFQHYARSDDYLYHQIQYRLSSKKWVVTSVSAVSKLHVLAMMSA